MTNFTRDSKAITKNELSIACQKELETLHLEFESAIDKISKAENSDQLFILLGEVSRILYSEEWKIIFPLSPIEQFLLDEAKRILNELGIKHVLMDLINYLNNLDKLVLKPYVDHSENIRKLKPVYAAKEVGYTGNDPKEAAEFLLKKV